MGGTDLVLHQLHRLHVLTVQLVLRQKILFIGLITSSLIGRVNYQMGLNVQKLSTMLAKIYLRQLLAQKNLLL